jgi:hypothetical protein
MNGFGAMENMGWGMGLFSLLVLALLSSIFNQRQQLQFVWSAAQGLHGHLGNDALYPGFHASHEAFSGGAPARTLAILTSRTRTLFD